MPWLRFLTPQTARRFYSAEGSVVEEPLPHLIAQMLLMLGLCLLLSLALAGAAMLLG